jgi:ABC-type multidrug transport system ATPase subunit
MLQERFHALDGYALDAQVGGVLTGLGFGKEDWARQTDEFSGGWQMRIALAKLLLAKPNLLLLDEPTNHLDLETRNWLEDYLKSYPFGYILISHDRYFLDVTIDRTVEIWNKRLNIYQGNYTKYLSQKDERRAQLQAAYRNQRIRSSTWRPSSTASAPRPPRPSRCSRIKELEKIERIEIPEEEPVIHFKFPQPPPSGRMVVEAEGLSKSYGAKQVLNNVRFTIERGDRVALVGVNGAGKSTLIKLLTGDEAPTAGTGQAGPQRGQRVLCAGPVQGAGRRCAHAGRHQPRRAQGAGAGAALAAGLLSLQRRRCLQAARRALGRRAQPLRAGADSGFAVEFSAARRADQPPGHARQGRAAGGAGGLQRHGGFCLARSLLSSTGWPRACSKWKAARSPATRATTRTICAGRRRRPQSFQQVDILSASRKPAVRRDGAFHDMKSRVCQWIRISADPKPPRTARAA